MSLNFYCFSSVLVKGCNDCVMGGPRRRRMALLFEERTRMLETLKGLLCFVSSADRFYHILLI
jgi:hypothetical protein